MSVTSLKLRNVRVRWRGSRFHGALFPFFDLGGTIRAVMLVERSQPVIHLAQWQPGGIKLPFFGDLRFASTMGLRVLEKPADADVVNGLWHFDRWWLLQDERFADHEAVPYLLSTNAM